MELLASLTIAGTALVTGATALGHLGDRYAAAGNEANEAREEVQARMLLRQLMAAAAVTVEDDGVRFAGLDAQWRGLPDDDLTFTTLGGSVLSEPGSRIRLFVARDQNKPAGELRVEVVRNDGTERRHMLMRSVAGLELEYLTFDGPDQRWSSSWVSQTVLPFGIRVTVLRTSPDSGLAAPSWSMVIPVRGAW